MTLVSFIENRPYMGAEYYSGSVNIASVLSVMIKTVLLIMGSVNFSYYYWQCCTRIGIDYKKLNNKNLILVVLTNYFAEKTLQNC